jgi:hypothetical protein
MIKALITSVDSIYNVCYTQKELEMTNHKILIKLRNAK